MEWTRNWSRPALPAGAGWREAMLDLLRVTTIPDATKRDRYTGKGAAKQNLKAKQCAPGVAPWLLRTGDRRCGADVLGRDQWTHLVLDIDAAPLSVQALLEVVDRAFGHLRCAVWTTWSCRDGYASARVLLPLSRTVKLDDLASLWWWARAALIAAGLPADSAKPGEPSLDPRLDERLYYMPSVPASLCPGDEDWGGVRPRGFVTSDETPRLDVDALLPRGRNVRTAEEGVHKSLWPSTPLPGKSARAGSAGGARPSPTVGRGAATTTEYADWSSVPFAAETLLSWAVREVPAGTYRMVGSPFRDDGGSGLSGRSLAVHKDAGDGLWATDFARRDRNGRLLRSVHFAGFQPGATSSVVRAPVVVFDYPSRLRDEVEASERLAYLMGDAEARLNAPKGAPLAVTEWVHDPISGEMIEQSVEGAEDSTDSWIIDSADYEEAKKRAHGTWTPLPACRNGFGTIGATGSTLTAEFLPCGAHSCPACGPSLRRCLAASVWLHVRDAAEKASIPGRVVRRALSPAERTRLRRAGVRVLVVPKNAIDEVTYLLPEATLPEIEDAEAVKDLALDAEQAVLAQSGTAWKAEKRSVRGSVNFVASIVLLRDALVGRKEARSRFEPEPEGEGDGSGGRAGDADAGLTNPDTGLVHEYTVRLKATGAQVIFALNLHLSRPLERDWERRTGRHSVGTLSGWVAPGGEDLAELLRSLVHRGTLPNREPPRPVLTDAEFREMSAEIGDLLEAA